MKLINPKWPPFLPLILTALAFAFLASVLTAKNKVQTLPLALPTPSQQTSFTLAVQKTAGRQTDLVLKLVSPLPDVSAFSLRLNCPSTVTNLKINPELEKDGWIFPIQKNQGNRLDLSGVYPKLQRYSFQSPKDIAYLTIESSFDPQSFKLDTRSTKIVSKLDETLTPTLIWEKI